MNRNWLGFALGLTVCLCGCGGTGDEESPAHTGRGRVAGEKIEQSLAAAQQYMNTGRLAEAQAILITLIDRAPHTVEAHELYGQVLTHMAMEAEQSHDEKLAATYRGQAYEKYRAAVELRPDSAGLQHAAGVIAFTTGRADAALEHFQAASRIDPDNPQFLVFEAQLLIQAARHDEARSILHRVLSLDPDEAIAHASLAMIALSEARLDEARQHISEARRLQPDDIGIRAQEARIHRRIGDPRRALELLVGLSAQERAQEVVTFEIAACYDELAEYVKAAEAWALLYEANPRSAHAWKAAVRAGELWLKADRRDEAWKWLQIAKTNAPEVSEVLQLEGAISRHPNAP